MRSIGKRNITKLNKIIDEEINKQGNYTFGVFCHADVRDRIMKRIPSEWYDIWESAWAEIERLVDDGIMKERYAKTT